MKILVWMSAAILILGGNVFPQKTVDRILAQVNEDIITLSDINREMAQIREELAQRYSGEQLEQEVKNFEKNLLEELIRQKLLLQKATELGFGANVDIQVSAYIERLRKENNLKDMDEFERVLEQQGMNMTGFRDTIKKRIITESLVNEFVSSRITVLSQEIEKYYKDHVKDYSTPEEVTLSEIIIPFENSPAEAKARIREIHKRLTAGESFVALASQYSKGPTASKGGGIGSYTLNKLNPEITNSIATVKEGHLTDVMESKDGFVIFRVDSRKQAAVRPLEELRDEIRNRLWQQKFNPEYERFITQLKEDAYVQIFGEGK